MALPSHFDPFLLARIPAGPDGADLSVLSLLARFDLDPWEEAERLAALPRDAVVQRLTGMLTALPKGVQPLAEARAIALHLVPLLGPAAFSRPAAAIRRRVTLRDVCAVVLGACLAVAVVVLSGPPSRSAARDNQPSAAVPLIVSAFSSVDLSLAGRRLSQPRASGVRRPGVTARTAPGAAKR